MLQDRARPYMCTGRQPARGGTSPEANRAARAPLRHHREREVIIADRPRPRTGHGAGRGYWGRVRIRFSWRPLYLLVSALPVCFAGLLCRSALSVCFVGLPGLPAGRVASSVLPPGMLCRPAGLPGDLPAGLPCQAAWPVLPCHRPCLYLVFDRSESRAGGRMANRPRSGRISATNGPGTHKRGRNRPLLSIIEHIRRSPRVPRASPPAFLRNRSRCAFSGTMGMA